MSRDLITPSMRAKLVGISVTIKISFSPGSTLDDAVDESAFILPLGVSTSFTASDIIVPVV